MTLTEYRCPAQRFRRCGLSSFVDASALTRLPVCSVCNAVMYPVAPEPPFLTRFGRFYSDIPLAPKPTL